MIERVQIQNYKSIKQAIVPLNSLNVLIGSESQRVLNVIEPGMTMTILKYMVFSETVLCVRSHFQENLYYEDGNLVKTIDMVSGGAIVNVPARQRHNLVSKG